MVQKTLSISIVVPAYNEEQRLVACLDAIARQSDAPDEVIVVDNNSTDATASVAQQYPFVRVVKATKQGIVYARNCGFDAVQSDIIARIDADTIMPTNWVSMVRTYYSDPNHARHVLTGGCYFYNIHNGRLVGWLYDLMAHHLNYLLLGHYLPWGSNSALPREAWLTTRDATCRRKDIHEDIDLGVHLNEAGYHIDYQARMRVGAEVRRIVGGRSSLWRHLSMWPRTLRVHNERTWRIAWSVSVLAILGSYGVLATEKIASVISGNTLRS